MGMNRTLLIGLGAALLVSLGCGQPLSTAASNNVVAVPLPVLDEPAGTSSREVAVLAGGCFWGVQGVFEHVIGVSQVISGYTGGSQSTAQYELVGSGTTGHAESVQITFDPQQISYGHLLQIYFSVVHDPTELNRQGPDVGTEYRSTIFPTSDEQARVAQAYIDQLQQAGVFSAPVVTTIESNKAFYAAETYHQDFLVKNPSNLYIQTNDLPKVENLKKMQPDVWRDTPVLVGLRPPGTPVAS
jgi:peptide-methionine (S)-S-oxide reductase